MPAVNPRLVAAGLALVLAGDAFLLWGDRVSVVTPSAAVRAFRAGDPATAAPPLPAPGVYVYDTTGFERVNRLSIRRDYPRESVRVVRHGFGCAWREEVRLFEQHTETYDVCTDGADARDTGFGTRLSYYYVDSAMALTCGTGGTRTGRSLSVGESRTYACTGEGVSAQVTVTYEGEGTAVVDEAEVPCRWVVVVTVLSGSNVGGARRALCTDERTGLVLTEERSVGVVVRSRYVGRVTYSEQATFRLRSLVPLT